MPTEAVGHSHGNVHKPAQSSPRLSAFLSLNLRSSRAARGSGCDDDRNGATRGLSCAHTSVAKKTSVKTTHITIEETATASRDVGFISPPEFRLPIDRNWREN